MLSLERLCYLLVLAPFVADRLSRRGAPWTAAAIIADLAVAVVIAALVLLMRNTRRLNQRIDTLRKTMNEAIIHDLKNPMAAVMGCLTCAVGDELTARQREKLLGIALHSCRVQMSLLETLVDTSRLEHGELVARKLLLKPRDVVEGCLKDIGGTAVHLRVKLESEIPDDLPPVIFADPDLLPRAIYNLMHNALKYSASGDAVSLKIAFHDGAFHFRIKDTGIGIAPDHISRLFKKYYRVEGADQTGRRGSGLGLYFCRLVVEAHGGAISVTSAVGQGTTIVFSIPQAESTGAYPHESHERPRQPDREPQTAA